MRLEDPDCLSCLGDRPQAGLQNGLSQGSRAPIQDGDFPAPELELDAVESKNIKDSQEMFQSLNAARVKDQAGAVQGIDFSRIDLNL